MIEVCVRAGGFQIGQLIIERQSGGNSYDDINTYTAALRLHNIDKMPLMGHFTHRYGDEWPIILHEALGTVINRNQELMRRK